MAHPATKRFSYSGQAGILLLCIGLGIVLGGTLSLIPAIGKMDLLGSGKQTTAQMMDNLLRPENAPMLRWMQFISTLFMFFVPAVAYARICHRKPAVHLGLDRLPRLKELLLVLLIMLTAVPAASVFQELTMMLPWSKQTLATFKAAEEAYYKQVAILVNMRNFGDYLTALLIIAFLPALFEEILFRGAIQNLLSRWLKWPLVALLITSMLFSAIHGSYMGFLSRLVLGVVLGWIYLSSGKLWLSVLGHFMNNALAATSMYLTVRQGKPLATTSMEEDFPVWVGLLALAALSGLLVLFHRAVSTKEEHPGEEVVLQIPDDSSNPFADSTSTPQPQEENAAEPPSI